MIWHHVEEVTTTDLVLDTSNPNLGLPLFYKHEEGEFDPGLEEGDVS